MVNRKSKFIQNTEINYVGGRIEQRTTYVCENLTYIDKLTDWNDAHRIIMVESKRIFKNGLEKESNQTKFYISSKKEDAVFFGSAVRKHWSIENHNAPENMAILRKMALQLLLKHKRKDSLKKVRKRATWNEKFLIKVLTVFSLMQLT